MSSKYSTFELSKYLKYKSKYLNLKKMYGGSDITVVVESNYGARSINFSMEEEVVSVMAKEFGVHSSQIEVFFEDNIIPLGLNASDCVIKNGSHLTVKLLKEYSKMLKNDWEKIITDMLDMNDIQTHALRERILREQIYKDDYLESVSIKNIYITKLPNNFGNFELEGDLQISHTALDELPELFGNIHIGGFLNLSCNKLTSLPENFSNIKVGYTLPLSETHNLPRIGNDMRGFIILNGNNLGNLPTKFGKMVINGDLWLNDNEIVELPESFGNLIIYGDLELAKNNLIDLPPTFKNIVVSGNVNLSYNLFTQLPKCLGEINQNYDNEDSYTIKGDITIGNMNEVFDSDDLFNDENGVNQENRWVPGLKIDEPVERIHQYRWAKVKSLVKNNMK